MALAWGIIYFRGHGFESYKTSSAGEQICVSFSLLFHCVCFGRYGLHGGCGHCCRSCLDAQESYLIATIHFLLVITDQMSDFGQFKECVSDGPTDGRTDGHTLL